MMYRDSYRKLKKGFALLIAVCMLTVMIPAEALAAGDEDGVKTSGFVGSLTWTIDNDTLTIKKAPSSDPDKMSEMPNYSENEPAPWAQADSLFSKVVIGENIDTIGNYAFYGLDIDSIEFPDVLDEIGDHAFMKSGLPEVMLPESVRYIYDHAFAYSDLEKIDFPAYVIRISDEAFAGCKNLVSVELPEIDEDINGSYLFKGCTSLERVVFPESDNRLGVNNGMFEGCIALTDVTIPKKLSIVRNAAFKDCTSLRQIVFPESDVRVSLGRRVFSGCTNLKKIYFQGLAPDIEDSGQTDELSFSGLKNVAVCYFKDSEEWESIRHFSERYGGYGCPGITYHLLDEEDGIIEEKEIPLEPGQKTYIEDHRNFIRGGTYDSLVDGRDVGSEFLTDFGSLKPDYEAWKAVRGEWFESPYDQVLATMILSEESAETQENAFTGDYLAAERSIVDDLMALINREEPDFSSEHKSTIEKILLGEDHSDELVYNKLDELFTKWGGDGILEDLFQAYDQFSGALDLIGQIDNGVELVREMTKQIAVLEAYANTDENFRQVLSEMADQAEADGNADMAKSLNYYVSLKDDYDIEKAIQEVKIGAGGEGLGVIYGEKIKWNVGKFLYERISPEIAGTLGSFLGGIVIGYDLTVALDKKLRNTDGVSDAYLYAYAAADLLNTMKPVLEKKKEAFVNTGDAIDRPTWEKAEQFCHSFGMYTRLSLEVCRKVAEYFSSQMFAGIIDRGGDTGCEALAAQWNVKQIDWLDVKCHSGAIPISGGTTTIIHGEEIDNLDIRVCGIDSDDVLLEIKDGTVLAAAGVRAAAAISDNGMVLISLPEGEACRIELSSDGVSEAACAVYAFSKTGQEAFQLERIAGSDQISLGNGKSELYLNRDSELLAIPDGDVFNVSEKEYVPATLIRLTQTSAVLRTGRTLQLKASVLPAQATSKRVVWISENPEIASVTANGLVTGKKEGTAVIRCMTPEGDVKAFCTVKVSLQTVPAESAVSTLRQKISGPASFKKTVNAKRFSLKAAAKGTLSYRSSNAKVASVNSSGMVTVKKVGKAAITITAGRTGRYRSASKKVTVTVIPKGTKIKTVKALKGKKKARVIWKRNRTVTGYQIQYSRYPSMKKAKRLTIRKNKTVKKTVARLKKGKRYYFRVRTYKKSGGTKYYSNWSGKKSVKVR